MKLYRPLLEEWFFKNNNCIFPALWKMSGKFMDSHKIHTIEFTIPLTLYGRMYSIFHFFSVTWLIQLAKNSTTKKFAELSIQTFHKTKVKISFTKPRCDFRHICMTVCIRIWRRDASHAKHKTSFTAGLT